MQRNHETLALLLEEVEDRTQPQLFPVGDGSTFIYCPKLETVAAVAEKPVEITTPQPTVSSNFDER